MLLFFRFHNLIFITFPEILLTTTLIPLFDQGFVERSVHLFQDNAKQLLKIRNLQQRKADYKLRTLHCCPYGLTGGLEWEIMGVKLFCH